LIFRAELITSGDNANLISLGRKLIIIYKAKNHGCVTKKPGYHASYAEINKKSINRIQNFDFQYSNKCLVEISKSSQK